MERNEEGRGERKGWGWKKKTGLGKGTGSLEELGNAPRVTAVTQQYNPITLSCNQPPGSPVAFFLPSAPSPLLVSTELPVPPSFLWLCGLQLTENPIQGETHPFSPPSPSPLLRFLRRSLAPVALLPLLSRFFLPLLSPFISTSFSLSLSLARGGRCRRSSDAAP